MKLPLKRIPYSGSTDSWIADANRKDIARCSVGYCKKCGELGSGNVAFPDKVAQQIVDAVNAPVTLTEQELQAVAVIVALHAKLEREDVMGAVLKTGAFRCLGDGDSAVVALGKKLKAAYERAMQAQPGMWTPFPSLNDPALREPSG